MTDIREDASMEQAVQQPTDEVEALRKENEELKRQLEEMRQTLKTTQDELATLKQNPGVQSEETPSSGAENPDDEEVNVNRLYKFGKSSLEQNEVKDVLKGLKEPYKSEIRRFIKENQIKELQDYLNKLIDENVIDKSELKRVCEGKGIWVYENGHILSDGMFGPQTMEAIRMLKESQQGEQQGDQQGEQQGDQQGEQQGDQQGEQQGEDQSEDNEGEVEITTLNDARLGDLKIEDLGAWNEEGSFVFKDGLIDPESEELILGDDRKISKLGEGDSGLRYTLEGGRLLIGNFENGLLNGSGVEFSSRGDEYRNLVVSEERPENSYGLKIYGKWENGVVKDGIQTFKENGLDVHVKVEGGETTKCYLDDESKAFDLEKIGDSLYLKNGENSLKLKNLNSVAIILKILYDYQNKEGEFYADTLRDGFLTKKLSRRSSTNETNVVYSSADNLVESPIGAEASVLASWLNESRKSVQGEEQGEEQGEDEGQSQNEDQGEQSEEQQQGGEQSGQEEEQAEYPGELPNGIARQLVNYVNDNLASELAMGSNEKLVISGGNPNRATLSLSTGLNSAYSVVQYPINIKKCINADGSIAIDYVKNSMIPEAKENLKDQKKAVLAVRGGLLRGKEYDMEQLFGDDDEVKSNLVLKTKLENYFKVFEDQKITFDLGSYDDDTKFDNGKIKLTLDDNNRNEDYNKWKNNPDILIFPAKDIIDDDYKLNESKFKEKLKGIVKAIAEKENLS